MTYVEQGHVRVGPDTMTDPAFLVTRYAITPFSLLSLCAPCRHRSMLIVTACSPFLSRNMEDFVTWVDTSKLKRHVARYNDEVDDFDLMETR